MIIHYLKVAVRQLLKYKMQNLISIVGLAVGLFCFCVCFYITRFVGSVDECFENHERLVEVYLTDPYGDTFSGVSGKLLPHLQQRSWEEVENFTLVSFINKNEYNLIGENDELLPYELSSMEVDSLYYKVFTPTLLNGSWAQATNNRNSIVLTRHTALRMFGDTDKAIGHRLVLPSGRFFQRSITYTIQAVIEDLPENTSMNFMRAIDMLTVNDDDGYESVPTPDLTGYTMYALLKDDRTASQLDTSFRQSEYTFRMFDRENSICAKPLGQDHRLSQIADMMALVTGIIGFLILLAASLNFFHFQTGSFLSRGREFSIRKILGNTTMGLFGMQFVQIVIVILAATLVSGCLIELASPFLHISLFRFSIQMGKEELLPHLIQYMGCLLILSAMVAFGIALYIRHSTMRISLHGLGKTNGKKWLRNTLLGIQFFICWLFVSITIALYLQAEKTSSSMFDTLTRQEKKEIITIPLDYNFLRKEDRQMIINHIRQHTGVSDVMFTDVEMVSNRHTSLKSNPDSDDWHDIRIMSITPNYAGFMGIGLEGQPPQKSDEILIGRTFASRIGGNVIGTSLYNYQNSAYVITGIIDDITNYVYNDGYGKADYGEVYSLIDDEAATGYYGYVKCHPGKAKEVRIWIVQKLREVFPASIEPKIGTLQEDIVAYQPLENNLKGIILSFSIVCLIITLLGVYSAITLDTERRQKEVAIRKVNGAGMKQIVMLFARMYLWLLGISAVLAFPIVWLVLQQWKQMYTVFFHYGILFWGGIVLAVSLVTALTVMGRILKITRINPARIIKTE